MNASDVIDGGCARIYIDWDFDARGHPTDGRWRRVVAGENMETGRVSPGDRLVIECRREADGTYTKLDERVESAVVEASVATHH